MTSILMKGTLKAIYLECFMCGCLIKTDEYSMSNIDVGVMIKNCPCCGYGRMNRISKEEARDILSRNKIFININD